MAILRSARRRAAALVSSAGVLAAAALTPAAPAVADTGERGHGRTALSEYLIPGGDPGVQLYLRERRPGNRQHFDGDRIVLFLEPFGVPSAEAFDVPGYSWLEERARAGFDAWALDFRNFGRSSRDAAMTSQLTKATPALTTTAESVRDVRTAIRFIRSLRGGGAINLVGWSWGGVVAAAYAGTHPGDVSRLVLDASMHAFDLPMMTAQFRDASGTFTGVPDYQCALWQNTTQMHWTAQMGADASIASEAAMAAVRSVFDGSDAAPAASPSCAAVPGSVRRAMGPMRELYDIWSNVATFDPAAVTAPVLTLRGDRDFFAEAGLADLFLNAPQRREIVIPDATHWALYETNRDMLLDATADFLDRHDDGRDRSPGRR